MTKSVKAVIIAAAVLLVLGGVLLALVLTAPGDTQTPTESSVISGDAAGADPYIVDKDADAVVSAKVKNSEGEFVFTRQKRVVSETNESGEVTSKDEYYWTSGDLKSVPQNDSTVRYFIANLASLPASSTVEENAEDLEKYGLSDPQATVKLEFDDGTGIEMYLGIQNPADASGIYFRTADSDTVKLVNYYAVSAALSDVKQFAELSMTDAYDTANGSNQLDSLVISRRDFETPVEIRYMYDIAALADDDDNIVTTFNTHRFVSPVTAEVDTTKGREVCYGVYGLTMDACEYLEQTDENMKKCGLDDPHTVVSFKYGGKEYELLIGNEIREEISGAAVSGGASISSVKGYYAIMEGVPGIYSLAKDSASWCTFKVEDLISHRPLSPYIYSVDSVEVTVPDGTYKFDIDGENKTFSCGGKELLPDSFRDFYQTLIGSVGEEMYSGEISGEPYASVTFNYDSEYFDRYGTQSDTISYYESGDRKCIVVLNGTPMFKVRKIYADRLLENTSAIMSGGTINIDW